MRLWYTAPASRWDQALPIGNGRMGAMIYGGIGQEKIQLNEDTVWNGKFIDRNNPDCLEHLGKIRELIFADKIEEAERLATYAVTGLPQSQRCFQTLGEIVFQFYGQKEIDKKKTFKTIMEANNGEQGDGSETEAYERSLCLEEAIARTCYTTNGQAYEREIFLSYPDDVMVIHMKGKDGALLNFDAVFERRRNLDHVWKVSGDTIAYDGNTGEDGIRFTGMLKASAVKGGVKTIGEHLIIEDAEEVTLIFTACTSMRFEDPEASCKEILEKAAKKSFEELKAAHVADYQNLFNRTELTFDCEDQDMYPTDVRLQRIREGIEDPALVAMYYQYGRYMLIVCSRPGSMPANLQGIWCDQFIPIWDSKYTININTEMNYWPAETGNLSECQMPLFDLITKMKPNGQKTAQVMYGCRGMVAHHNTDVYGDTAPQDKVISSTYWPMGAAWLCTHIMEHYEYTQDLEFLKEQYDNLYQAVLFFQDFLVEDPDGFLVTCPSLSPENTFITESGSIGRLTAGPAMDNQILTVLFNGFIKASELLGRDEELREAAKVMRDRLPKTQIGQYGQIMEWRKDYAEIEPGHRHVSQLYGVYPGNLMTVEETPEFIKAAQATLERRLAHGGGHTGWSRAWIILLWTRFRDGEKAWDNIRTLLSHTTYDNLMDNHPLGAHGSVFQIDGNMGAAAGITEMLVQSYGDYVVLLPAVAEVLSSGSLKGLKIRGGAEANLIWKDGKVVSFEMKAEVPMTKTMVIGDHTEIITLKAGETYSYQA